MAILVPSAKVGTKKKVVAALSTSYSHVQSILVISNVQENTYQFDIEDNLILAAKELDIIKAHSIYENTSLVKLPCFRTK